LLIVINIYCAEACHCDELVYAVNLGGEAHEDLNGILYQKDILSHRKSTLRNIAVASAQDQPIYRTMFQDMKLMLDLPIKGNGLYKLILKFPYEHAIQRMDIFINGVHHVVKDQHANTYVGSPTAYDRIIYFSVLNNKLTWKNQNSTIIDNKIKLELSGRNFFTLAQISAIAWTKSFTINNTQPILHASENKKDVTTIENETNNILQSLKNIAGLMEKMLEKMVSSPDGKIVSDNAL
jgi:hypothetical protein